MKKNPGFMPFLFFVFFTVGVVLFYIYRIVNMSSEGAVATIKAKYSQEKIDLNCDWSEMSPYLECFRKDFFKAVRKSNIYSNTFLLDLERRIYVEDIYRATSDEGKLYINLVNLELLNFFFHIHRERGIKKAPNFILRYFAQPSAQKNKEYFLEKFEDFKKLRFDYSQVFQGRPVILKRYRNAYNEAQSIAKDLKEASE